MRATLFVCLCFLALFAAACGGKSLSSSGAEEGSQRAAWYGSEEAMLQVMREVGSQYATTDPAEAPVRGVTVIYYGQFSLLAELLPLGAEAPADASEGEGEAAEPDAPSPSGIYGFRVTFERGLSRYEDVTDKLYDDLVRAFDQRFPRV